MKKYWFLACLCALCGTLLMAACDGSDEPEPGPTPPSRPADLPDNLYAMVKWEGSTTTCFMNKDAYMLYQPGLEPRLDCQMDSNYFHLLFDEEGHLKYIRGPLLQMHTVTGAAGGKETATKLYVTAYGKSFVLTDDDGEEGAKAVHRKENALDNTTLLQGLSLTELQLEGLSEALEIEDELKGSTGSLGTPDAKNRDIRRFLNMTRMLNRYMQMSDKSSSQLAQTIQSACPDKGEVSCAVGGVLGSSAALTADEKQLQALIGAWKETVNGGSSALVASRSEWARRPIVFMGVNTEVIPGTNSCTVNFFGELLTTGIGEVSNFVYGVCVTEVGSPVTAESLHRIGKFKANARGEVKSITIPERFVVEGLKPGTEYVCRFYLQSYRDYSYMFEQKGTRFSTDAPLDCENDAGLQVLSAQYYSYLGFAYFRCKATATKPSAEHISRWGVSVGDGFYPVSTLDDDDDDDDAIFVSESRIIRNLATKKPCVIIGRCANWVLRNDDKAFRVFVTSNRKDAVRRVMDKDSLDAPSADKRIEQVNTGRNNHYFQYTGRRWTDARDYDLVVNTSALGVDECADLIVECIRHRGGLPATATKS